MSSVTVKAAGFAFISPEVLTIHYDHTEAGERLYLYPSTEGSAPASSLEAMGTDTKNVILLRDISKRKELARFADKVYRLLIFARPDALASLNIPILDAAVSGKRVEIRPTMTSTQVSTWIAENAIDLDLGEFVKPLQAPEPEKKTPSKKRTLRSLVSRVSKYLKDDEKTLKDALTSMYLRIVNQYSSEDFKQSCKDMVKSGVPKSSAKVIYRWVEGVEGDGAHLSKALDQYFDPDLDGTVSLADLAEEHEVSVEDMKLVIDAVEELEEEEVQ